MVVNRGQACHAEVGADDRRIVRLHAICGATGIDAPFGWPEEFVRLVRLLPARKTAVPGWFDKTKPDLLYRVTDHYVKATTGKTPLSVSTNWIAVPALRCQGLLARMGVTDRSGDGRVFEAYPAAALICWGLISPPAAPPPLPDLVDALLKVCTWMEVAPPQRELLETKCDAFDALICALIARAADLDLTNKCPDELKATACTEGWFHLPTPDSLGGSSLCR